MQKSKPSFDYLQLTSGKAVKNIILALLRFYQVLISPLGPPVCRFYPSCSEYFYQAVEKWGVIKGTYLGIRRLLRCHPFHAGGYDPVE
ncbi:MAG: membrane protein insertion efficiency factor YidD [Firmicutes bacterium]|mgnify:FL=1|nr:membrane protein insertion efficiency factor YidD [Bacillota bacterium]